MFSGLGFENLDRMMNNPASRNGFVSGYTGGFLDINREHLQNPGRFLELTRNNQHPEAPNDPVRPLMDMNSSVENDRSVGVRELNDMNPREFTMGFGSEKIFRPIPVMGTGTIQLNGDSSDEDDPSFDEENGGNASGTKGRKDKDAPWRRMKWTDKVVRLLIQVVANVGDDGSLEGADGVRRKSGMIKKGKWRTVSKILISKGYQASPQQCEDKFNDLNKRYKKLNDILGKGISCKVVENPGLLEKMSHLSDKAKEDVKKLLSSRHLFYREICAYHNGLPIPHCSDLELHIPPRSSVEKLKCNDSLVEGNLLTDKVGGSASAHCSKDQDVSEDEEEDSEEDDASEDDSSDDEANAIECVSLERMMDCYRQKVNGDVGNGKGRFSSRLENLQGEIDKIFNDPTKSKCEQKEWIKKRMLQLEEERIGIQAEALELEKQRLKWQRFCDQKESQFDMARLDKERLMLVNERKTLQLKKTSGNGI